MLADPAACGRVGQPIPVLVAAAGWGGGTYSDTGSLALVLPDGHAERVTANLAFSVN